MRQDGYCPAVVPEADCYFRRAQDAVVLFVAAWADPALAFGCVDLEPVLKDWLTAPGLAPDVAADSHGCRRPGLWAKFDWVCACADGW